MKRKAISQILAVSLSVALCAQSIPIYAAEEIGTSAAADFFAEDFIENQSLNEGDAETNTETNAESNTETNTKADATTGISEAYTLEESNSAITSEETVTDKDGFWSGESETVESSANGSDGWESAEMDGAEAGDEAVKRDAAAFVSGDVEENVEETGETNELEEALSESAEMTEGDFSYVIVNNSYARITRYSGSATSVQVPSTIGGYAVQVIGARAFQGNTVLESVELPDGLTTIYAYAFENCTSITSIHLPDSITTMGYKVFGGCSNLVSANYPVNWVNSPSGNGSNSYEYGNVFSGCPKLTEIEISEGVKAIAPHSFANLTTLTRVTLPSSLTEIGRYAFAGAIGLTEVTIPENTQIIRDHAFADCTNLTQINLSEGLTTIYAYAFENCTGITSIHLPDSITTLGYKVFGGCSNLVSANYPVNWVNSPSGNGSNSYEYGTVFSGCPKLTEIEIPEGVKVIAPHSFANLTTLTRVTLPSSLTEIGRYAFAGAIGLTEVTIPENTQIIRDHAFADCTNLTQINLSEGLTTIYAYAFENCTGITNIHLPDSITTLGYKVFGGCSNLVSANYPVNWVNSPSGNGSNSYEYGNVFSGCPKLTEIEIPEGVKAIAPHSFASLTSLTSVTLPSSLTEIGAYAFAGATGLTEVTLPSNTKTIRDYAFADCAGLKDIYIPDSTTDIRKAVFENCPQLTIHCSYYSMATIYAIENNIPFEQIGTYTDSAETVLDRSDTSYYGDFGSATANGYVAMTVRYNIKDTWKSAVSDLNVKLVLPSNGELDESTLKVDGELCQNYNLKDRTLTIPVSGTSGIIRFSIKAQSQSAARSYAILNYKKNRNSSQEIIGVLNESINLFTIDAPDVVSKPTVNVSGMANAGGTVTLLVNAKEQQTVQVSKAGLWSAVLTLENPSNYETYKIKALCTQADGTTETRTAAVTYNEGEPSIESFKMYYNEHDKIKSYDLTKTDGVTPLVYYLPKSKFDYELTFENPEQIKTLYVTSTRNNQTKYLEATYDPEKMHL